jgi:Macrocin-O-methyltransferase (TylF)
MPARKARSPYRFGQGMRSGREQDYLCDLERHATGSPYSMVEKLMNFPAYVPRQSLASFIVKYEIFKHVLDVQGSVVECGVSFGGGLMTFAQLSAIFEPTNHQRRIIGFDTFAGIARIASEDKGSQSPDAHAKGLAVDSYVEMQRCIELYDDNRFVGHVPKVELVRGDATKTIPKYVRKNPQLLVSLLYLDFDVYEPTKIALQQFLPRMPKGAIVAFDELNLHDWPGETVATLQVLKMNKLPLKRFSFGSTISYAVVE